MKSKIFIKHWLELKPNHYSSNTDLYYLKVANKIHSKLSPKTLSVLLEIMDKEDIKILCCFITCYFEDVISETNIWQSFKKEYSKSYNKQLPFFTTDEDYIDDEINAEDIAFLMWYFANTIQQKIFLNPYNDFVMYVAELAMEVLDEEYDYAPENKSLKTIFQFNPSGVDEFYETREFLQLVFLESYLLYPDVKQRFDFDTFEILTEDEGHDPEKLMAYLREVNEDYSFNKTSSLLSLKAKDWAKHVLGESHPSYNDISSISEKIKGLFFYKKQTKTSVFLEHIASGMEFEMTKKSFDNSQDLNEDSIIYIGLVKYKKEWWFSGNFLVTKYDADTILDQKNSATARADINFLIEESELNEIVELQKKVFLKFNDNSLIKFIKGTDVNDFFKNYKTSFNNSLQLRDQEVEAANQRAKDEGYFGNDSELSNEDDAEFIIFFNPKSGIEFFVDLSNAFPDKRNPFFTEESHEDVQQILMAQDCSTEFVNYLIENYKDKLSYFKKEPYKSYLNEMDFLLKFWKKENYKTKNMTVLTGN